MSVASATVSGENAADEASRLGANLLGWGFLGCSVFLITIMAYFVFVVLSSLTQPTPLLDKLVSRFVEQTSPGTTAQKGYGRESTSVHLAIILEYANADIRAAGIQVAFALIAGLFFATIGILLFAAGAVGQLDISGDASIGKWKITTAAPGLVAIGLGAFIIAIGINKSMSRPLQADVMQAMRMQISAGVTPPPRSNLGEGVATDQTVAE